VVASIGKIRTAVQGLNHLEKDGYKTLGMMWPTRRRAPGRARARRRSGCPVQSNCEATEER